MDIQGSVGSAGAAWRRIAKTNDLPEGEMISTEIGAFQIAVYNVSGTYFATENICTHAYAKLTDGWLDGHEIECPLHAARFDVRTGQVLSSPATCGLKTFPVRVSGAEGDSDIEVLLLELLPE